MQYKDPFKLFLLEVWKLSGYLEELPENEFSELPYVMDIVKLEKGEYLFKPGD